MAARLAVSRAARPELSNAGVATDEKRLNKH